MEEKRDIIEATVRSCTSRLGGVVTEEQIQTLITRLMGMKGIKEVVNSLALNIDQFFGRPEQREAFDACMQDILELSEGTYQSISDIIAEVQRNKAKNYTPGNISVEENHRLIEQTLKTVCDRLNELGVDYYLVGALSTFIGTRHITI